MARQIFISYASADKDVAERLCEAIESRGARCWIAPRDIPPAASYDETIVDAIEASALMVLVFSGASNGSNDVANEVRNARAASIRVVPVRIEDVPLSKALRYHLSAAQWIDALGDRAGGTFPGLAARITAIASALETSPAIEPGSANVEALPVAPAPASLRPLRPLRSRYPWRARRVVVGLGAILAAIVSIAWLRPVDAWVRVPFLPAVPDKLAEVWARNDSEGVASSPTGRTYELLPAGLRPLRTPGASLVSIFGEEGFLSIGGTSPLAVRSDGSVYRYQNAAWSTDLVSGHANGPNLMWSAAVLSDTTIMGVTPDGVWRFTGGSWSRWSSDAVFHVWPVLDERVAYQSTSGDVRIAGLHSDVAQLSAGWPAETTLENSTRRINRPLVTAIAQADPRTVFAVARGKLYRGCLDRCGDDARTFHEYSLATQDGDVVADMCGRRGMLVILASAAEPNRPQRLAYSTNSALTWHSAALPARGARISRLFCPPGARGFFASVTGTDTNSVELWRHSPPCERGADWWYIFAAIYSLHCREKE